MHKIGHLDSTAMISVANIMRDTQFCHMFLPKKNQTQCTVF